MKSVTADHLRLTHCRQANSTDCSMGRENLMSSGHCSSLTSQRLAPHLASVDDVVCLLSYWYSLCRFTSHPPPPPSFIVTAEVCVRLHVKGREEEVRKAAQQWLVLPVLPDLHGDVVCTPASPVHNHGGTGKREAQLWCRHTRSTRLHLCHYYK